MRQINITATNKSAVQKITELARGNLSTLMATQLAGDWYCMIRWGLGTIDHLEPQFSGQDLPGEETGHTGPTAQDMRRIERAVEQATALGLRRHPYGRLQLKIAWQDGQVTGIQHTICESHKIEPVLTRD